MTVWKVKNSTERENAEVDDWLKKTDLIHILSPVFLPVLNFSVIIVVMFCFNNTKYVFDSLAHSHEVKCLTYFKFFKNSTSENPRSPDGGGCITKGFWSSHSLQRLYNFGSIPRIKCRKSRKIISSLHEWWFLSEYTLRVSNYKAFERQDQSWHCSVTIKSLWRIKGYEASSMERQVWNHKQRLDFAFVYVGVESSGPGLFTLEKVRPHSLWAGYTEQESCSASSCWYVTFLLHFISYKTMSWLWEQILCADLVIYHMAT